MVIQLVGLIVHFVQRGFKYCAHEYTVFSVTGSRSLSKNYWNEW